MNSKIHFQMCDRKSGANALHMASAKFVMSRLFMLMTFALLAVFIHAMPSYALTAPTITPAAGVYAMGSGPTVSMSAPIGQIYYTLDGTVPSITNGTLYSTAFQIAETTQINAVAYSSGVYSSVTTAPIAIDSNYPNITSASLNPVAPSVWYRGDVSIVANSGNVTALADVSGIGNNATATSPNQPTIKTDYLNASSVINFNSSVHGQFIALPAFSSGFASGFSAFLVMAVVSPSSGSQLMSLGNGSNLNNAISLSENASLAPAFSVYNSSGSPTTIASSTAFTGGQYQLLEVVQSGSTAQLFTNGVLVAQSTSMNALPASGLSSNYVGQLTTGGSYFQGQIAELVIYPANVTSQQRETIESYFTQKYQIPQQTIAAPIFSMAAGTLSSPAQVAIWAPPSCTIYVTTDGTTPTASSPVYGAPILVPYTLTLKALAVDGNLQSSVTTATYTLDSGKFPAPAAGGPTLQINQVLPSIAIP